MTVTVRIKGADQLIKVLDGDMKKAARIATFAIAQEVRGRVAKYPPLTAANVQRPWRSKANNRWYERGWGQKWVRKDGSIGGRQSSELLNRSWGIGRRGYGAYVGNRATYAPAVHHYKEQASFHARRGWKTDREAVDEIVKLGLADRIVQRVVRKILKARGR